MNHRVLEDLYDATEEDLLYGIGLLALPNEEPAPCIHIHYRGWSREKLEIVRESFDEGLILVCGTRADGRRDLYLGTRQTISVQAEQDGHTSMLRAPAWDARLSQIDASVVGQFETNRRRYGGFLLLVQTPEWEFFTAADDGSGQARSGEIVPRSMPVPLGASD